MSCRRRKSCAAARLIPQLLGWFRAGHAALVETLASADPGLVCATFMAAPSPLAFWARRQAHETAIHRADAESASGIRPGYPADFAADGLDELITGFGQRGKYRPPAQGGSMQVRTTDTGHAWDVGTRDGRVQASRDTSPASRPGCVVSGPASGLYLFLWNRSDAAQAGVTISGDPGFLSSWQSSVCVQLGLSTHGPGIVATGCYRQIHVRHDAWRWAAPETDIQHQPDRAGAPTRRRGRRSTRVVSTGLMTPHAAPRPGSAGSCALRSVP